MRLSVPRICSWIFESIDLQRRWDPIQIRIVARRPLRARQRGVDFRNCGSCPVGTKAIFQVSLTATPVRGCPPFVQSCKWRRIAGWMPSSFAHEVAKGSDPTTSFPKARREINARWKKVV